MDNKISYLECLEVVLPYTVFLDGLVEAANSGEIKAAAISTFQHYLVGRKISHILGRVHHPQTNGKIERFYETFQSRMMYFESIEELITWYNTKRPHMSLNWDELETPIQAFFTKVDRRRKRLPFIMCR